LRPLKTLRDKTNDQTSEKPKSKPVMQTSLIVQPDELSA
jgi:hypothetical protein